jgi:hypothetical protein
VIAMNVSEATDVGLVLDYLLNRHQTGDDYDRALAAAERLADRAHQRIGAGLTGRDVVAAFEDLDLPGCMGCGVCEPSNRTDHINS